MKYLLLIPVILMPWLLAAQSTEGEVTYTETIQLHIDLPPGDEAMRNMIPSAQSAATSLLFNENQSIYQDKEVGAGTVDVSHEENGMDMQIKVMRPENKIYRDVENGRTVESREFMGRFFLIDEEAPRQSWKLTGEQKTILGYPCQKALLQDTSRKVEAWFTPQIPVSIGPGEFADLPGLILEISNGDRTAVATKVDLKSLPKNAIEKPTKGKSVTRAEFKKLVDEKMKEMGAEGGGGGVRMIIRN
jgi:GLPGLI family protein